MIELTIEQIIVFIVIIIVATILCYDKYLDKKSRKYIACDYTVVSKKTGIEYNCIGIKDNKDSTKEILIYNHISQCFEWWSIYQFEFKDK
jgi:type IV secretory pathway VirB6-like protein